MVKRTLRFLYIVIVISMFSSACDILYDSNNKVVVSVGDTKIRENELRRDIINITFEMGITDQEIKPGIKFLIEKVVDDYLILEYGKEKSIQISENELETTINEIKKEYKEERFQEILLQENIEYKEWKEGLRKDLLIKKISQEALSVIKPIPFDEIKEYFENNKEEFKHQEMVELRQIVTRTRGEAKNIQKMLTDGKDMGELAKKYSITPEAKAGGKLGWIEKGELEEVMENMIFSLPIGRISKILKTPYGYHLFEVLSKRPAGLSSLPECMEEIERKLFFKKKDSYYREWLDSLRNRYTVVIDEDIYENWSI